MNKHKEAAIRVILEESTALAKLAENISPAFEEVVDIISYNFKGRVILTGIGKSGYIAHKIAASFSSTGTAALYLHPAEASHGDLGMITENDLVIMLSTSGETKELSDIINFCKRFTIKIVAITMNPSSALAVNSDYLLLLPQIKEASIIIAPTTSTLMMLALGDAMTVAVQEAKGFSKEDFLVYHPGGKLGANLLKVRDVMRTGLELPIVYEDTLFTETVLIITQKSLGCAMVVNRKKHLLGIITDGDLRRHLNSKGLLKYAKDIMTLEPKYIEQNKLATEALAVLNKESITTLAVTDDSTLVGILHIHDLLRAGVT